MRSLQIRSADGTELRLARWGESNSRDILLLHGLAEHVGRYIHVAEFLEAQGYRVTFLELRGHGASKGQRGHTQRWARYTEDVRAAAATIGQPFALVAHSMGGLVSLDTVRDPVSPPLLGLALSNPLVVPAVKAPEMKLKAARVLSTIFPWLPLKNEIETRLICRDPQVVRDYEADPLVYETITPRWGMEMLAASTRVQTNPEACRMPLRMMVSDADQICDHQASLRLAERWGGAKEIVLYRGLYHELFNEPEKAEVLSGLGKWLGELAWA
jgi:alpha-beta hydrolase superfamily lysophospholipase